MGRTGFTSNLCFYARVSESPDILVLVGVATAAAKPQFVRSQIWADEPSSQYVRLCRAGGTNGHPAKSRLALRR